MMTDGLEIAMRRTVNLAHLRARRVVGLNRISEIVDITMHNLNLAVVCAYIHHFPPNALG